MISTPVFSKSVYKIWLTVGSKDKIQGLAAGIAASRSNLFFQKAGYSDDIFHQSFRIGKNGFVHMLQDVRNICVILLISQQVSVVDMTVSVRNTVFVSAFNRKAVAGLG